MSWYIFWKKPDADAEKPKLKICCACPETKVVRDECIALHGPESTECAPLIEAHKVCLRAAGFQI